MDKTPTQPQKSATQPQPVSQLWRVCGNVFSARRVDDRVVVRLIRKAR